MDIEQEPPLFLPPRTHVKFSSMTFVHPSRIQNLKMDELEENEDSEMPLMPNKSLALFPSRFPGKVQDIRGNSKGWLESDDITEF